MPANDVSYKVGSASLFAAHARGNAARYLCDWCGKAGTSREPAVLVEGYLLPADHLTCQKTVKSAGERACCCFELMGDNSDCPVHGGK